jgi:hypothetical protein
MMVEGSASVEAEGCGAAAVREDFHEEVSPELAFEEFSG